MIYNFSGRRARPCPALTLLTPVHTVRHARAAAAARESRRRANATRRSAAPARALPASSADVSLTLPALRRAVDATRLDARALERVCVAVNPR